MALSTFRRYELKFKLTEEQFSALYPKIIKEMQIDKYCLGGRHYNVHNIYYDTKDSALIRASIAKPGYKEKLRLRSYTLPRSADDAVFLELKKKTAGIVHKRRAVMSLREADEFVARGRIPDSENYIDGQVAREISWFLSRNPVAPAVYVGYKRIAFFGRQDPDFRLTFDYDIVTRRSDLHLSRGMYGTRLLEKGTYLMEVKIAGALPLWLSAALSGLKIYKTSFSKYGTEYKQLCGALLPAAGGREEPRGQKKCVNY